jgi:hypothetical protein
MGWSAVRGRAHDEDQVVFNDDWVAAASVKEPSVEEIIRQSRRARRRAHRVAALRRWFPKAVVMAGVAVVTAWSVVAGPLHSTLTGAGSHASAAALPPTPTSSTSTTIALTGTQYSRGDCVSWDQRVLPSLERATHVVPCSGLHLIEIIMAVTVPGGQAAPFPTEAEWQTFNDRLCGPLVLPYLGYPLDPAGQYLVEDIHPLPSGWSYSDRTMWCGIGAVWPSGIVHTADQFSPFAGTVKGHDQTYLYGTGTCLAQGSETRLGDTISCSEPHVVEITGTVAITNGVLPATDQAWENAVGSRCHDVTLRYAGGHLPVGVTSNLLPVEASSWAAGRRTVECVAERPDGNGQLTAMSGSVHPGG